MFYGVSLAAAVHALEGILFSSNVALIGPIFLHSYLGRTHVHVGIIKSIWYVLGLEPKLPYVVKVYIIINIVLEIKIKSYQALYDAYRMFPVYF